MGRLTIQPGVMLSIIVFTGFFAAGAYLLWELIDHRIYKIIVPLMCLVLYINILRFFIYELCSLETTRITEFFNYVLMYAVTGLVILLPFFITPAYVFELDSLRTIIIIFAGLLLLKYFSFMLLGPWHDILQRIKHRIHYDHISYRPKVSVMIPAWNEGVGLLHTIQSVLKSDYQDIELVVINDGSTDDSDTQMKSFVSTFNAKNTSTRSIVYRYQGNTGKGGALNHAVAAASGDILISIDADCIVEKTAISELVKVFKDPSVSAAVGNVKIANKSNSIGIVQYLEFLFSFYFKRAEAVLGTIYIIGGAAGAFRKEVFKKIGGYSTTNITEDIELSVRIQDAGMKIEFASEAVVYTEGASDLKSLKNQRLRWKRGRFQTFYQHMHMFFSVRRRHNKFLTLVMMPLAMLQELQLLLEIPFLIFLYAFSVINSDFTSFFMGVMVVGMMFVVQFMFYDPNTRKLSFIALAPIGWLLFYIATYVEAWALIKSIQTFVFKKEVVWQKWERKGIGTALSNN